MSLNSINDFFRKVSLPFTLCLSISSAPALAGCQPGETKYLRDVVRASAYAGGCWVSCDRDIKSVTYTAPRGWVVSNYSSRTEEGFGRNGINVTSNAAGTDYSSNSGVDYSRNSSAQISAGNNGVYGTSQNNNYTNSQQLSLGTNLSSVTLEAWAQGVANFKRTGSSRKEALSIELTCTGS